MRPSTGFELVLSISAMKMLVAADLHYALKQFDWLKSVAADFDVVVLAGDLLEIASSVERRAQIVVVRAYLEELVARTRVIVCSGNHDLDGPNEAGEMIARWISELGEIGVIADWGSVDVDGTLITVCPWWDGDATRAAIGRQLAADALKPRDRWIWVYHAPPAESPVSWNGRRYYGDTALTEWIRQYGPDFVLSGHVHQSPFVNGGAWADRMGTTWVFNTGQQIGPTPAHIAFELAQGEAIWTSLEGRHLLSLGVPAAQAEAPADDAAEAFTDGGPTAPRLTSPDVPAAG
jgi:Icc-related predicted phosphoesterase